MRTKETLNKGTKAQEKKKNKNQTLIKTGLKKKKKKQQQQQQQQQQQHNTTQHVVMPMYNLHISIFILHLSNPPPSFLPILGEKTFWWAPPSFSPPPSQPKTLQKVFLHHFLTFFFPSSLKYTLLNTP